MKKTVRPIVDDADREVPLKALACKALDGG